MPDENSLTREEWYCELQRGFVCWASWLERTLNEKGVCEDCTQNRVGIRGPIFSLAMALAIAEMSGQLQKD